MRAATTLAARGPTGATMTSALALLERQIAHVEIKRDVDRVALQMHAVRLHFLVSRLVELAGIE